MNKSLAGLLLAATLVIGIDAGLAQTPSATQCYDLEWTADTLRRYPEIAQMCEEVIDYQGEQFVKVSGIIRRSNSEVARVRFPAINQTLDIDWPVGLNVKTGDGNEIPPRELRRGDRVRFYVNRDRLAEPLIMILALAPELPVVTASEAVLPETASSIPLIALLGSLFLLAGAGLGGYRRALEARDRQV